MLETQNDMPAEDGPTPPENNKHDKRSLPYGLRRYRPGIFEKLHAPGAGLITASMIGTLFGVSRLKGSSRFATLAHITGHAPLPDFANERILQRGKDLEAILPQMMKRERPEWHAYPVAAYAAHPDRPALIASPDGLVWQPGRDDAGLLEIKVVSRFALKDWHDENGEFSVPIDIELQHQTQFACCPGAQWGLVAVILPETWELRLVDTVPHPSAIEAILRQVNIDLEMIERGELPDADDTPAGFKALCQIYAGTNTETVRLDDEEAIKRFDAWQQAKADKKAAEAIEDAAKRWLYSRAPHAGTIQIGNARRVEIKEVSRKEAVIKASTFKTFKLIDEASA